MPLALWSQLQWATLAIAPIVGFLLTGVENIGVMIENPMLTLPMDSYCESIRKNIYAVGARWASGVEVCLLLLSTPAKLSSLVGPFCVLCRMPQLQTYTLAWSHHTAACIAALAQEHALHG